MSWPRRCGGISRVGTDVVDEGRALLPELAIRRKNVFLGGQMVFASDSFTDRRLHNHTAFGLRQRLYRV